MKKKKINNKVYKKTLPLNIKKLGNKIEDYPFVEIHWLGYRRRCGLVQH